MRDLSGAFKYTERYYLRALDTHIRRGVPQILPYETILREGGRGARGSPYIPSFEYFSRARAREMNWTALCDVFAVAKPGLVERRDLEIILRSEGILFREISRREGENGRLMEPVSRSPLRIRARTCIYARGLEQIVESDNAERASDALA